MELPQWSPRRDSELRKTSAIAIAESVLSVRDSLAPAHLREILSIAVWKFTECDGKYSTRFRSEGALFAPSSRVHHEHVVPRRLIVDQLLSKPGNARAILSGAIGCVVLREEHHALGEVERENESLSGWDRYRAAGIIVWDLQSQMRVW